MSVLLYVLGGVCALCGAVSILFGIPVKEFSFGDTLIAAGTTGLVGGLILIGLGAAVGQLQRIAELLGARPLARAGQSVEPTVHVGSGTGAGRFPFPPKPKAEARERSAEMPVAPQMPLMPRPADKRESEPEFETPPSLPNPDMPLMAQDEAQDLPLSPRDDRQVADTRTVPEEKSETEWRSSPPAAVRPAQPSYFDSMWPAPGRKPASPLPENLARAESIPRVPEMKAEKPFVEESEDDVQPAAVLKSGVVDGMGYTLYVDGSIEAELPQGTLRFASINDLRSYLEKNA
jgi:hypothetical protein